MNVFFSRDEEMSVHYYYFFSEIESWHYLQDNLEHGVRLKPVKTRQKNHTSMPRKCNVGYRRRTTVPQIFFLSFNFLFQSLNYLVKLDNNISGSHLFCCHALFPPSN